MKKTAYIAIVALGLVLSPACKKALKDAKDYYPQLSTSPAVINQDGTVQVSANVSSTGHSDLEYIGFCMDTVPVPNMLSNQHVVEEMSGSTFATTYSLTFDPAKTYYFRSFASNKNGYSYGNVVSLKGIKATPLVAPCTINMNTSSVGLNGNTAGSIYQVTKVSSFSSTYDISTSGYDDNAGYLTFRFGSELKTKVFTTTKSGAYGDLVQISVSSGFVSGSVDAGFKVYVNQLSPGVYDITMCQATWSPNGFGPYNIYAHFRSPY